MLLLAEIWLERQISAYSFLQGGGSWGGISRGSPPGLGPGSPLSVQERPCGRCSGQSAPHSARSMGHFADSPASSLSFPTGNSRVFPGPPGAGGRTGRYHRGDGGDRAPPSAPPSPRPLRPRTRKRRRGRAMAGTALKRLMAEYKREWRSLGPRRCPPKGERSQSPAGPAGRAGP